MKQTLLGLLFIGLTSYTTQPARVQSKVYICVSSSASVYHQTRECRGLSNCTHTIKAVTENEAVNDYARRKCRVCY